MNTVNLSLEDVGGAIGLAPEEDEEERRRRELAEQAASQMETALGDTATMDAARRDSIAPPGEPTAPSPVSDQRPMESGAGLSVPSGDRAVEVARVLTQPRNTPRTIGGLDDVRPTGPMQMPQAPQVSSFVRDPNSQTPEAHERMQLEEAQAARRRAENKARIVSAIGGILGGGGAAFRGAGERISAAGDRATREFSERAALAQKHSDEQRAARESERRAQMEDRAAGLEERRDQRAERVVDMQVEGFEENRADRQTERGQVTAMRDPASSYSRTEQSLLRSARDGVGISPEMLSDEAIAGMSAEQMRSSPFLRQLIEGQERANIARLRQERRISVGAGSNGPAAGGRELLEEALVADLTETGGMTEEQARLRARALPDRDLADAVQATATGAVSSGRVEGRTNRQEEEQHRIAGWSRRPDAPVLGGGDRTKAMGAAAEDATLSRVTMQLYRLAQEVTAMQRAGAAAGALDAKMAQAKVLHEQAVTALRNIGNYGVPQGTELQRMESIAPRLDSVQGFLSAANQYRALGGAMRRATEDKMRAWGFSRGGG